MSLGHNYVGTGQILLAIVREKQGHAARMLLDLGADPQTVRDRLLPNLPGSAARKRPASATTDAVAVKRFRWTEQVVAEIRARYGVCEP